MKAECLDYVRARNEELTTLVSWIEESEAQGKALEALLSRCEGGTDKLAGTHTCMSALEHGADATFALFLAAQLATHRPAAGQQLGVGARDG